MVACIVLNGDEENGVEAGVETGVNDFFFRVRFHSKSYVFAHKFYHA